MKLAGRQALITGASRGFGRQLAQTFWREGASLLLVARTVADLETVQRNLGPAAPDQTIHILAQDLTLPTAVEKIATEGGRGKPSCCLALQITRRYCYRRARGRST